MNKKEKMFTQIYAQKIDTPIRIINSIDSAKKSTSRSVAKSSVMFGPKKAKIAAERKNEKRTNESWLTF